MIRLLTSEQMRGLDRATIDAYGLPGMVLMEHAGLGVARTVARRSPRRVVLVCGKGNNGGDGFVAGRWLARWGIAVELHLLGTVDALSGDARTNADLYRRLGLPLRERATADGLAEALAGADVIVDALLGTGVSGPPRAPMDAVVEAVNAAGAPIVAVDLPTGINADTGEAYEPYVRADETVTFAAWKRGLAVGRGAVAAGRVEVIDIGLPHALLDALGEVPARLERSDVAALLPRREPDAHKGDAGLAMILAGSRGLGGAAALTGRGAAKGGAGLVRVLFPESLSGWVEPVTIEAMSRPLPEEDGALGPASLEVAWELMGKATAVGFGPGVGTSDATAACLAELVRKVEQPLLIDADGLNLLAKRPALARERGGRLVLTPHPGEAGRLLDCPTGEIQHDRLAAATAIARRYQAVVLLKGHGTILAEPGGRLRVSSTGSPTMASGGMGDGLTGVLTALLAQGLEPFAAVQAGAWVYGRAAELAAAGSDAGILATDVLEALPRARAELHDA